jgi:hypothetical protein
MYYFCICFYFAFCKWLLFKICHSKWCIKNGWWKYTSFVCRMRSRLYYVKWKRNLLPRVYQCEIKGRDLWCSSCAHWRTKHAHNCEARYFRWNDTLLLCARLPRKKWTEIRDESEPHRQAQREICLKRQWWETPLTMLYIFLRALALISFSAASTPRPKEWKNLMSDRK